MVRRSLLVAVVVCLLVGTCVALASQTPLPLRARLIERGDFAGFRPESTKQSFKTAKAWVAGGPHPSVAQTSAEIARLRREGFVAVLSEFLDRGSERGNGLSWVMQLGSAASARAELNADLAANKAASGGSFSAFSVPAIPGARGFRVSGGGAVRGEHLLCRRPLPVLGRPRLLECGQESAHPRRSDHGGDDPLPTRPRPPGRVGNDCRERRGHRPSPLRKRDISVTATLNRRPPLQRSSSGSGDAPNARAADGLVAPLAERLRQALGRQGDAV